MFDLYSGRFSERKTAKAAEREIARLATKICRPVNIMEVCGTHTMAIAAGGIRKLLPWNIKLLSGPGCPVCVTSAGDIDSAVQTAFLPDTIITTFGDMLKVRGSDKSLSDCLAEGADVRLVYSPIDALAIARENPGKNVIFTGVGFETTIPAVAATVVHAEHDNVKNFFVLSLFKLVPPALRMIVSIPERRVDGFLLPGHVSAVIGAEPYRFLASEFKMPCVIAGFEPLDILAGVDMLLRQIERGKPDVEVEYTRAVKLSGNSAAMSLVWKVFEPAPASWRAVGVINDSGLAFRKEYARFDAAARFNIRHKEIPEPAGCLCGKILLGMAEPEECGLFGKTCKPESAIGPCMVSSEGACAARYKYRE